MSMQRDVWEATHNLCDTCGEPVPTWNDMCQVMARMPGGEMIPALWHSRHFLPVWDQAGGVRCEGSPSRSQYLDGQPRDTRGYPYIEKLERLYREAWQQLQLETHPPRLADA